MDEAVAKGRAADHLTRSALGSLEYFQDEEILARKAFIRALAALTTPRLEETASLLISNFLSPRDWLYPRVRSLSSSRSAAEQLEVFRAWAKPHLLAALSQAGLLSEVRSHLENGAQSIWPSLAPLPQVDMARAEKILLDPTQKIYGHYMGGEAYELLGQIKRLNDPKFIPLLVKVLREVPAARSALTYSVGETMLPYARNFPEAMRSEFIAQGMEHFFDDENLRGIL